MSSTVVFDGGVARRIIPPAPSPSAGPISPHLPRGPPENGGGLSSVPTPAPLIGVASAPGPVLASRTAATAAAARQKMAFLSDAVSPSSETSFNRLNSIRDYGPTISDIRVPCPKPYLPKHTLSSVDAWGAPKRCATEFAESEGDSSLEWLVRALPPPLPPPVLLQRSAPASLESARSKLEPTTLVQSVTTTFSGNASAIIQQATFPCPTGLSFSASTNSAGCTTKGMSPALSPEQPTKMPPKEDKSTQPEIQSEEEDVESVAKAVAPDAAFSAPNAQYTLFNLISRMTKSLGDANSLTQPAAGDAPVTPRPGSAAAAAVAAAAAAAAATFASSGAYGGETDDQPPPFVFECNSEATAESSSSSSDSDDEDDDEDEDEDDIEDDVDTHPKTTGGEETQKTPSQTLSEFLRAISKENGELDSNAGATLRPGASGGACGGSRAAAGVCRAGGRSSSPRRPLQSQRAAARGRRHAKQRSQQRRGRRGARSRGASAYAAAARGASGASRRRRTSRSRASRRASVTSHASKMKPAVSVKSQSSVKTPRGGPIASEDDASPGATTTGTTGSEESPRSYADVLDRLARQDSSLLLRARRTTEKRRRAAAGGARKGEGGAGRRARAQKPAARSVGGGGAAGRSAAGASAAGAALSAAAPPRPGASPVGRVPRLDAAAATVATTAGRSPGQGPPAPPPSPASSKRSAVAAYASNPMLVPPGETQEAGDCSEDSLAFWLRIICGPQRDGEAVDSLVRSQQVFAECARLLSLNAPLPSKRGAAASPAAPLSTPFASPLLPANASWPWPSLPGARGRLGPATGRRQWPPRESRADREERRRRARERQRMRAGTLFTRYLAEHRVRRPRRRAQHNMLRRALLAMSVAFAPAHASAARSSPSAAAPTSPAPPPEVSPPQSACPGVAVPSALTPECNGAFAPAISDALSSSAVASSAPFDKPSVSPRKCALGAAKTIWARAEPPCPASTQPPPPPGPPAPPAATCATTVSPRRGGKLPVYALPKVSDTSATVSCGQSGHAQAQSAAPIWNTTFPRPSKKSQVRYHFRAWYGGAATLKRSLAKCPCRESVDSTTSEDYSSPILDSSFATVSDTTTGTATVANAPADPAPATTAVAAAAAVCKDTLTDNEAHYKSYPCAARSSPSMVSASATWRRWLRRWRPPRRKRTSSRAAYDASGPAAAFTSSPNFSWGETLVGWGCSTRHSNPSQPQCLAQWDRPLPAPAAPVTPSVAKTTRAPHRCALGDQLHLEGTHRCHRPLGAKGDAAWPCAADACERCCGDCAAGRARRKAWVRALAKRRSWMRQRVSAHALLARPCYKRLGLKGHAAATPAAGGTLAKTDHACGGKEGNGSRLEGPGESSRAPDSPRREACSAPVLARAGAGGGGGARVGRTIRERRAQAGNSGCGYMSVSMASACCAGGGGGGGGGCGGGCGGAGASGARRTTQRRLRCAFTSVGGGGAPHRTQSPSKAHAPLSLHPPHQQPPPPPPPRNLQPICCIPTSPPSPTQTTLLTSQLFINPADLLCTPTPLPHHSKNTHLPASSPAPALSSPLLPTGTLSPPPMVHCPPPSTPSTPPSQARGSHSHGAQRQAGRRVPRNSTAYALGSQSQGATDASAAFCGGYSDVAAAVAAAAVTRTGVRSRGRDVILVECMPRRGAADGPRAHRRVKDSDGPPTRGHSQRSASPAVASLHRHREQAVNREGDGPAVGGAAARAQAAASSRRVTRSRHKECSGAGAQRSSSPAPPTPTTPPHAHAPTSKHRSSRPPRAQRPAKQRAHADDVARVGKSSVKTPVSTTSSTGASAARPRPLTDDSESAEKSGSRRVKSRNTKMPASSEGRSQRLDEYRSSAGTSVKRAHGRVHSNTRLQSSKARSTRGGGACDRSHGSSEGAAAGGGGKKSRRHARRSGPQLETRASSKRSVPRKDERERESEAPPEAEASLLQLFFATEMYSSHTESERSGSEHDGRAAWSVPMMVPMVMPMAVPMALPMAMPVAVPLVSSEEGVASRQSSKRSVDVSRHGSSWSDPQVKTSETVCKPLCASPSQRQLCSNVSEEDNRIHHVPPVVKIKQCRKNEVTGKSTELVISVIKDGVLVTIEEPSESSSQSKGSNHVLRANSLSIVEITSNDVTNILDSSSTKSVTKRSNQSDTDAQPINREINATSNEASLVSQCTISTSSVTSPLLNGSSLTANETPLKLTEREATQGENDTDANHSEESEKNSETQPQPKLSERNSPTLTPGLDVQTKSYKDDRSTSDGEKLDIIGYTFHQLPSGHGSMKEVLPEENTINFIQKCSNTSATISRNKTTPHKSDISTKLERFSDDNDPFDHLPTTSRNTLVTAWNTRAYMKSTIDSECSSNVDTYSLICSRSTPSVTESYHDLRLTSTSSTDYSTLRNDEENSPFLSTFASRNRLFLSSVIYKASEPPPFSGIQSHFIPCVDSSEEDKLSLGTPDKSSSYEDASFVSQEESIEETAESKHPQEETVHEIINLQKGIDHPTSYAYSINNLLCSSDDSMGVDLPYNSSGAQRVCLVLSRSTFSQGESNPSVSETNTSESSAHENQAVVQSPTHICSGGEQGQLKDPTKGDECNTQLMNGAPENEYTSLTLHPSVTEGYTTQGLESLLWSGGALSTGIGGGDEEVESLATVSSSELEAEEAGAAGDVRKAEGRASTPASGDSRRSSPAARSVATSEQSRGKASLTLIVHDSDESLPEVDGVDDVAVLLLEPLERETRLAHRRQRAVGLAPDLVSDLPTLGGGGQRSPGRRRDLDRGRCRYRDLLTQVQQLEAHKRPESAPASGVELRASDRLASPSPKVRDRIQIYEYNHATAKATLRPSSAQRDVDLANSSTKVKERIKAFNTGKVSQEEKKQCSSGGPGICLAKRSPRQEVGHHDRNLRSVANSTASEFQLADVKVAEGCGAAAASSAGAAPAPPFSTPCALFADSRDSVSREEVLSGDRSHDDGCSRAAEWQTASVGAGDGARVSAGEKKLERRSTGASAGVEGVTHSPEGRNRTFSVLVATLAAAYLWYNMYVS